MKQRAARVILVVALLAIVGGAVFQAITRASAVEQARVRSAAVDAAHARSDAALAELAASQRGYVAPGQGLDFWSGKVDDALAATGSALTALRGLGTAPAAIASVDSALSRLSDFTAMDARAREYARTGQRSMASDLIFADGYEILAAARQEAAQAALTAREAAAATVAADSRMYAAAIGLLGLVGVVAALMMLRAPAASAEPEPFITAMPVSDAPSRRTAETTDDEIGAALDASLADLTTTPLEPVAAAAPAAIAATAPITAAAPAIDLSAAADVCVDLGRLLDARDLQSVLERSAAVLGADGIVIWIADTAGGSLSPVLTHGYAPQVVGRLGSIAVDSDNATAAAWRLMHMQVVEGALAVPMVTSEGCSGVMALELPARKERAREVQSLARIIAAQLAAVVVPAAQSQNRQAI